MPRLRAQFALTVSAPCLAVFPESEEPTAQIHVVLGEFRIDAKLLLAEPWRAKISDAHEWVTGLSQLEISVSREEVEPPPPIVELPEGRRDLTVQQSYLLERLPAYRESATKVANQILQYFRYELHTPMVQMLSPYKQELNSPNWYDEHGDQLVPTYVVMARRVPGVRGELGVRPLTPDLLPDLQAFVAASTEATLIDMLLADAQTAWFEKSLRRSVLELAICVEVLVKRQYFAQHSAAGAAFDYLEDKAKVSVRPLDLIDTIAKDVYGESFKEHSSENYQSIDHLFRCRNKVAHRGQLVFLDEKKVWRTVEQETVEVWFNAVQSLRAWLKALSLPADGVDA